jgi:hypothetical protein
MGIKFWSIKERMPAPSLIGFAIAASGAEIYNYSSLYQNIGAFILSNIAYAAGFWVAVGLWFKHITTVEIPSVHLRSTFPNSLRNLLVRFSYGPINEENYMEIENDNFVRISIVIAGFALFFLYGALIGPIGDDTQYTLLLPIIGIYWVILCASVVYFRYPTQPLKVTKNIAYYLLLAIAPFATKLLEPGSSSAYAGLIFAFLMAAMHTGTSLFQNGTMSIQKAQEDE